MSDGSFGIVSKENGHHITYLMSNSLGGYPIKKALYPPCQCS